jgi:CRP/FNR family cyclic AMP-dependent transcriptional regulator
MLVHRHTRGDIVANLLALTLSYPVLSLRPGEKLIETGEARGEMFLLMHGHLKVMRDGVEIARLIEPGTLVGEMSVLLGTDHSADVIAVDDVEVRHIEDGWRWLESSPVVALHIATIACQRLDRTSAMLVELRKEAREGREHGFLERLFGAVTGADTRN